MTLKFTGTASYITSDALALAVNSAIVLQKPLLVKGEPGTGKTVLAEAIAEGLGIPCIPWHIKSTTKADHGLYGVDRIARLADAEMLKFAPEEERPQLYARVGDVENYIQPGPVWQAYDADDYVVLLIDEIDKADIEFPNDLLLELDRMEFYVRELDRWVKAKKRPIVVITSNAEKQLPDAFRRRCVFHYIDFPGEVEMRRIVEVHHAGAREELVTNALQAFYGLREVQGLTKPPSTSELLDWIKLLLSDELDGVARLAGRLREDELHTLPLLGTLLKDERDFRQLDQLRRR